MFDYFWTKNPKTKRGNLEHFCKKSQTRNRSNGNQIENSIVLSLVCTKIYHNIFFHFDSFFFLKKRWCFLSFWLCLHGQFNLFSFVCVKKKRKKLKNHRFLRWKNINKESLTRWRWNSWDSFTRVSFISSLEREKRPQWH